MARFAGPRSNDGSEGTRSEAQGRMVGRRPFGSFWGNAKRDSRVRRETKRPAHAVTNQNTPTKAAADKTPTPTPSPVANAPPAETHAPHPGRNVVQQRPPASKEPPPSQPSAQAAQRRPYRLGRKSPAPQSARHAA